MITRALLALAAFVFLSAGTSPAVAQRGARISYTLPGVVVRGLDAAFHSRYGNSPQLIEPGTKVRITQFADSVLVRFELIGGEIASLRVEPGGIVSTLDMPTGNETEVVIPGREAAAMSVAFDAWNAGAAATPQAFRSDRVTIPQSKADFDDNRFAVSEQEFLEQNPDLSSPPGYYVSYLSPPDPVLSASRGCGNYTIYRVDPAKWRVVREPPIC